MADATDRQLVKLSLEAGSLGELLAAPLGFRFGLIRTDTPDVYRLAAVTATDVGSEALARFMVEQARHGRDPFPPLPVPSQEVAAQVEQWRSWYARRSPRVSVVRTYLCDGPTCAEELTDDTGIIRGGCIAYAMPENVEKGPYGHYCSWECLTADFERIRANAEPVPSRNELRSRRITLHRATFPGPVTQNAAELKTACVEIPETTG
jgi:hypothetical protein